MAGSFELVLGFSHQFILPSRNLSPFIRNGLEQRIENWTYMYKTKQPFFHIGTTCRPAPSDFV